MDVAVWKDIQAGFDGEMNLIKERVYHGGVTFYRSGSESDRLITRIAVLYGMRQTGREMIVKEMFTAIALHQKKINLRTDAVKIKLFGRDAESFDENAYYESFFKLDLANGLACWNEKDEEYRKALILGLSATGPILPQA